MPNAYMLFLARWARRLSWKETAEAFRTSWDKVFDAVGHLLKRHAEGHESLKVLMETNIASTTELTVGHPVWLNPIT